MSSPRLGAGTVRHSRKAAWACAMALVASAGLMVGSCAMISPVSGVRAARVAVGWRGNAETGENIGDFGLDGHCGLRVA